MNTSQLYNQFVKEAKKNPKKAGLLAMLLLAAAYVWGPLLTGAFTGNKSKKPRRARVATASEQIASESAARRAPFDWKRIAEAIDSDGWMKPGFEPAAPRLLQAFQASGHVRVTYETNRIEQTHEEPPPVEQLAQTALTPEDAQLRLTSTVVGGGTRLALISGRVYRQGAVIEVGEEDGFLVKSVEPSRVLLQRGAEEFELTIPKHP